MRLLILLKESVRGVARSYNGAAVFLAQECFLDQRCVGLKATMP